MQLTINHSDSGSCCSGNTRECQFTCNIYVCVWFGWLIGMCSTLKEEGCSVLAESMTYSFAVVSVESVWWLCPHLLWITILSVIRNTTIGQADNAISSESSVCLRMDESGVSKQKILYFSFNVASFNKATKVWRMVLNKIGLCNISNFSKCAYGNI